MILISVIFFTFSNFSYKDELKKYNKNRSIFLKIIKYENNLIYSKFILNGPCEIFKKVIIGASVIS